MGVFLGEAVENTYLCAVQVSLSPDGRKDEKGTG